jgi:deazaflavin-dependent oxidoreductase (nitroreductase family)
MPQDGPAEEVIDSPTGWVAKHIREYVESGGKRGHRRWGVTHLLLTTRGRRTGKLRRTALIYGQDGDRYVVVASSGGQPQHPSWYLNLRADPWVRVQVGTDTFPAYAATAEGPERDRLWELMAGIWPDYRSYQRRTSREIPVVTLEPRRPPG